MSVVEGVAHMRPTCDHFWDILVDAAESDGWEVAAFAAMSSGGVMAVMMFVASFVVRVVLHVGNQECACCVRCLRWQCAVCMASCIVAVFVFCVVCANDDSGGISVVVVEL